MPGTTRRSDFSGCRVPVRQRAVCDLFDDAG